MIFFFFFELEKFLPGQACEIISVHHPVFEGEIGKRIIITKVREESRMVWAHAAKPKRYRQNRRGRWVTEFDPRCVETIYSFDQIRQLPEDEAKELLKTITSSYVNHY